VPKLVKIDLFTPFLPLFLDVVASLIPETPPNPPFFGIADARTPQGCVDSYRFALTR